MLKRIDSFFIRVVTGSDFFAMDADREFPPGSDVHATNCLSSIAHSGSNQNSFATASIVSFSVHLPGGGEGPRIVLESANRNALSVANCARITFRLNAGRADAKSLVTTYVF